MKNGAKWYQRFPHTFLGGIQGMSAQDIAVYSVTLDLIYHHGGRVNNDPKWISGWINDMGSAAVRASIARLAERDLLTISEHGIENRMARIYAKTDAEMTEKRRENGRKGGQISGISRSKSKLRASENNDLTEASASILLEADKIREEKSLTDTSYLPDSMTDCSAAASQSPPISSEIEPPPAPAPECAPACDVPAPECARAKPEESESVKVDSSGGDEDDGQIALAVASFNRIADQVGWPKVKTPLSKVRKSRLKARIRRAGGVLEWIAAIRRGSQSAFLTSGSGRGGWKASFDFFAQESSFDKLIEGNYDDNHRKPPEKYDAGTEGARGAGAAAGSRNQRRDGGPHRGLLAGFAQASSGLDAHADVSGDGTDGPAHR